MESVEFPKRYNFQEIEQKWIKKWKDEETYKFHIEDSASKPSYSIDTPPPFTSGSLHMGHVLGYCWIDFAARYHRMRGFNVYLPQGFDCHGLPTELKVQHEFKIQKEQRDLFLQKCVEWTQKCISDMHSQFDGLGYSTDWSHTYRTMDENYIRTVQRSLLTFYQKDWFYRGTHPIHWCTNCETSLAKQEVGYLDLPGEIFELKLPLRDSKDTITIATTRPELMEACVGVFVHPDDYRYMNLVGKKVVIPICEREVEIFADRAVDQNFGTGIVYCCTFGDETDIMWQQKYELPVYIVLTQDGKMNDKSKFAGLPTKEARQKVVEELDKRGLLVSQKSYPHRVIVHTERSACQQPIEYLPIPQWFIKVKDFTSDITAAGEAMKWFPPHFIQRLKDWCDSLTWDWVISRQRVFGTPIPFWYCEACGQVVPADETSLPVDPRFAEPPLDQCPKCKGKLKGEEAVCDCWVDSSVSPLVITQWGEDSDFFKTLYPTTMRPQGYEIIRTWLFYTTFRCLMLTGQKPFNEVMLNGIVAGPDGRKMSKSFGNIVSPNEVFPSYGSDAIRLWTVVGTLGDDYPFEFKYINKSNKQPISLEQANAEKGKLGAKKFQNKYDKEFPQLTANTKFLTKMWNACRFVYLQVQKSKISDLNVTEQDLTPIDQYIFSRLAILSKEMCAAWDEYRWRDGYVAYRPFFWENFCDNYLEAIKYKFTQSDASVSQRSLKVVSLILLDLLKLIAPIVPFITEDIYTTMFKDVTHEKSIHLSAWPEFPFKLDETQIAAGKLGLDFIEAIRNLKSKQKIPLNKDLPKAQIRVTPELKEQLTFVLEDIRQTLRIINLSLTSNNDPISAGASITEEITVGEQKGTIALWIEA